MHGERMNPNDMQAAKAIVLSCPTRTRYRGDTTMIVRADDLTHDQHALVAALATETGASRRRAVVDEVRQGDPFPILGDIEYEFEISSLE
jgi:hypothetical protein